MSLYKTIFIRSLNEDNIAGAGGVFGNTDGQTSGDFYAPGDARLPDFLGSKKKKKKRKASKKKKRNTDSDKLDTSISHAYPISTRNGPSFGSFGTMSGFGG
jgi:hypothetical protein